MTDQPSISKDCQFFCLMWTKVATEPFNRSYDERIEPKYFKRYVTALNKQKIFTNEEFKANKVGKEFPKEYAITELVTSKDIPVNGDLYNGFNVALHAAIYEAYTI